MANRFVRRIKSGEIDSVEDLKSEFKELAKHTHPDLQGAGTEAEFVAARAEYEAALRDFERHRFGARTRGAAADREDRAGEDRAGESLADSAWLCLDLLLKRGFPKEPRHDKERLRYEYAVWRLEQALGDPHAGVLRSVETELLRLRAAKPQSLAAVLRLLGDLVDYRYASLSAMRTHILLSRARLETDPFCPPGIRRFLVFLAADLGIGGELGA